MSLSLACRRVAGDLKSSGSADQQLVKQCESAASLAKSEETKRLQGHVAIGARKGTYGRTFCTPDEFVAETSATAKGVAPLRRQLRTARPHRTTF